MIRIRRISPKGPAFLSWMPYFRRYEIELAPHGWPETAQRHITNTPVTVLTPILGVGDAWSFVEAADREWDAGNSGWAVEYEEELGN